MTNVPTRSDVMEKLIPYIQEETAKGSTIKSYHETHCWFISWSKWIYGHGNNILSKNMCIRDADLQKVNHIMDQVRK